MRSFLKHCKDSALIGGWLCIDDNSSSSDRDAMVQAFPQIRFIWKGPEEAGHARSMNRILEEITTPLLVHLEDDWEFSRDFRLADLVKAMERESAHQVLMVPRPNTQPISHETLSLGRYIYQPNHPNRDRVALEYDAANPCSALGNDGPGWWWPGFSLNPSLLDISFFRTHLGKFDEALLPEVMEYDAAARAQKAGAQILCADLGVSHIGLVSAYSMNDQDRPWDLEYPAQGDVDPVTPKVVHFAFLGGGRLGFVAYLAVLAARARIQPDAVHFYIDEEPLDNYWWRSIKPLVQVEEVANGESKLAIQLEKLIERGGICLELDLLVLRDFDKLISQGRVIADEVHLETCNPEELTPPVLIGPSGNRFFRLWLDRISDGVSQLPYQLVRSHPELTTVEPGESFAPFSDQDNSLFQVMYNEQLEFFRLHKLQGCYSVRLWRERGRASRLDLQDLDVALERKTLFAYLVKELLEEAAPEILNPVLSRNAEQEAKIWAAQLDANTREVMGQDWESVRTLYETCIQEEPDFAIPYYRIATVERQRGNRASAFEFARRAKDLPLPKTRAPLPVPDLHTWIIDDELAMNAYWIGRKVESFDRCSRLLSGPHLPDQEWDRVVKNRDFSAEEVKAERKCYPSSVVDTVQWWSKLPASKTDVTLTITACKRPELLYVAIDSFLNCCEDIHQISRWLCIDDGSSLEDLETFQKRYPFFRLIVKEPNEKGHANSMNLIRGELKTPYWLHLEDDWHFLARQPYISLAKEILEENGKIAQVLFNRNYGQTLQCRKDHGGLVKRTSQGRRFRLHEYFPENSDELREFVSRLSPNSLHHAYWPHFSFRPSLMRTEELLSIGPFDPDARFFEMEFAHRYTKAGFQSASFDVVNALHTGKLTWETGENAYTLNNESQFS